ncbi:extracellular solute-binding protein [Haladaptatus sp. NG-SE-30]
MANDGKSTAGISEIDRRRFVQALSGAGVAGIAGCMGLGGSDGSGNNGGSNGENGDSSGNGGGSSGKTTIKVAGWSATDDKMGQKIQSLLDQYGKNHDGVTAKYTSVQSKYKQKIKTQLGANDAPDAFWLDSSYSPAFGASDAVVDLSPYVKKASYTDDIFDVLMNAFNYEGKQYGIPKDFNTLGLFTHSGLLEKAGVSGAPKTWSELRSTLQGIKQKTDADAPMTLTPQGRIFWALVYQNGGRVLSKDGKKCVIASEKNVESLKFLVDLTKDKLALRTDQIGTDWPGQALAEEKTAITSMGAWGISYLEQEAKKVDKKVDVAHLPHPSGGQKATTAYVVSYSAAASTDSKNTTWDIIKLLTKPENALQFATGEGGGGVLSPYKSHEDEKYYQNNKRRKTMLEAAEWAHVWQYGPNSEALFNRVRPEIEAALLGKKSPQKALETAQTKVNSEVLN